VARRSLNEISPATRNFVPDENFSLKKVPAPDAGREKQGSTPEIHPPQHAMTHLTFFPRKFDGKFGSPMVRLFSRENFDREK
jgi:hypothetical protein